MTQQTSDTNYRRVAELEARHQADWNKEVHPEKEAGFLAARHCDEARALAYTLAKALDEALAVPSLGAQEKMIDELVIRADLPDKIAAEQYYNGSDMATIGHFAEWRIGIHTGQPGGDYRDTNLGDPEWTAKLVAFLLNYHASGGKAAAPSPVASLVERTRERGYAEVPHENIPTTYRPSVAVSGGAPKSPYDFEIGGPPTTAGPQPIDLGDVRPFLKDGESVSDCIARNRRDTSIVLGELAKEKFKSERLERELADMIQQRDFYAAKANGTPLSATGAEMPAEVIKQQAACLHPVTQVFFRAGLLACREYMARFVEAQDAGIAASIRANWWPSLGKDFGAPRLHDWAELTAGEYGTPEFRCKGADEVSPTQEALAIAYQFLTQDDTAPMAAMDGGAKP